MNRYSSDLIPSANTANASPKNEPPYSSYFPHSLSFFVAALHSPSGQIPDDLLIRANAKNENRDPQAAGAGAGARAGGTSGGGASGGGASGPTSDTGGGGGGDGGTRGGATSLDGVVREVARQLVRDKGRGREAIVQSVK